MPPGAVRAPFPSFIEPLHPTLTDKVPEGPNWLHEIKFDGYRTQAHIRKAKPSLYTRRGYDWTDRFSSVAEALEDLQIDEAIIDGEIIVADERGHSDFARLQADLAQGRTDRLTYCVFDLLYLNGFDLRRAALAKRKELLARLITRPSSHLVLSSTIAAEGGSVFARACDMQLEGIVSKQRDAPYRSGRQPLWLKTKCRKSDTFPIVAFVEKLGARPRRIASLYLGRREAGRLLYAGKAQTGFRTEMLYELRERLDPYIRATSPLSVPVKKPKATWVEPALDAEIEYSAFTADKLLRAPVFKGIREDLAASTPPARMRASRGGVARENILQLLPDAVVPSDEELIRYWRKVARRALPYLARRPLKLVRHTRGTTFYHRGRLPPVPSSVRQLKIQKREGGEGTRLWIEDGEGLVGLVSIGVVELHPWNSTVDDLEHPDVMVFDLDPGSGVEWEFVRDSALALRDLLKAEGLASWPKLTGGKGLHVMVPLERAMTHDEAHRYSREIAEHLASTDRSRYTTSAAMAARTGRLFIDYLRNGRGTTAVGTYSPRAQPGFPIAAPTSWKKVEQGIRSDAFTMNRPQTSISTRSTRRAARPDRETARAQARLRPTARTSGQGR